MIKAVIFDLDGTLTRPFLDFMKIRTEMGLSIGRTSVLDQIDSLSDEQREEALSILERHEREAAHAAEPNDGVAELFEFLARSGLATGIITRNSERSTATVLDKLGIKVREVITRDSGLPIKPAPEPLAHMARGFGLDPAQVLMVGDYRYDVECGRAAGALTCLVTNGREVSETGGPDYVVKSPGELIEVIEELMNESES